MESEGSISNVKVRPVKVLTKNCILVVDDDDNDDDAVVLTALFIVLNEKKLMKVTVLSIEKD